MNKIKNLTLLLFLAATTTFYGQRRPDRDKIKALRVAYFTERLDLSSNEAEIFWPVYNAHQEKLSAFRKTERSEIRAKLRNLDAVSDSEANALLDKYIALEEEKSKEQQSFLKKIKKILSAKKTVLLIKTEEDFKRRLIKQYHQKRSGGGGHR